MIAGDWVHGYFVHAGGHRSGYAKVTDELFTAGMRLKTLRERTGLSVREVAKRLEKKTTTYQYYEDDYKKAALPLWLVKDLFPIFEPYGIERGEVLALAGVNTEADFALSRRGNRQEIMAKVDEVDVRASAGGGQINDGEQVVAEWSLPKALLKFATNALPEHIKILTIVGDSMPQSFRSFDKVLVDTSDKVPSPPGIFALWDGLGLVVKRVEHIAFSDPPTVRIVSENPAYETYTRTLDEAHIQGRVLGKWNWM
jgi:phage repressor protein C with HTH and peptisase S24 domain